MEFERLSLGSSLVVQLEKIWLRSSAFGFPKVAQTDADEPIALLRTQVYSFSQF